MNLSPYISLEVLKQQTLLSDVETAVQQAISNQYQSICVLPLFTKKTKELLAGSNIKLATVIGFPMGISAIEAKVAEIVLAIVDGADELEIVANITAIKNGDWNFVANEINTILPIIRNKNKVVKIIIESGVLTDDEIIKCCDIYGLSGMDFIKTSTGFASKNVSIRTLNLLRTHLSDSVRIEASGGIKSFSFAKEMLNAGANRIATEDGAQLLADSPQ